MGLLMSEAWVAWSLRAAAWGGREGGVHCHAEA